MSDGNPRMAIRPHARHFDPDERRTKEAPAEHHDIRSIIRHYRETGFNPPLRRDAYYSDFPSSQDFVSAYEAVQDVMAQFKSIPAHIRGQFDNDPAKLLAFAESNDREALVELGLLQDEQPEAAPVEETPAEPEPTPPEPEGSRE